MHNLVGLRLPGSSRNTYRFVPVETRSSFLVPCGKCLACKSRRKSEVVFRMDSEKRFGHLLRDGSVCKYKYCFFCTLTYAPDFLPHWVATRFDTDTGEVFEYVSESNTESGLLKLSDFKDFMKRLRRYYALDCKVFMAGEYGDDGHRPHYHMIFYSDLNWNQTRLALRRAWSVSSSKSCIDEPGVFQVTDGVYKTFRKSIGRVDVKPVNMRRMRYVAKYCLKENPFEKAVRPFYSCSCNFGTGFLLSESARSVKANKQLFAYVGDCKRSSIGRYFTHRIFSKSELRECVDKYLFDVESPPDSCEFGDKYKRWYDKYLFAERARIRGSLCLNVLPKNLCYV